MKQKLKKALYLYLSLLGLMSISRLCFYYINASYFISSNPFVIAQCFLYGLRFDIAALCALNTPFLLYFFFPLGSINSPLKSTIAKALFVIPNSLALFFEIADAVYFPYNQKRSNADLLSMLQRKADFLNQVPSFLKHYYYVPLIGIICAVAILFIYKKIIQAPLETKHQKPLKQLISFMLVLILLLIGWRGGLQMVPIGIKNANAYLNGQYSPLILNSNFSFLSTLGKQALEPLHYYSTAQAQSLMPTIKHYTTRSTKQLNLVVIILESFSKEFTGIGGLKSYTPFLDSLMAQSLVCTQAFANGYRSAEGIPAILSGIPSLQEEPFTTSQYGANAIGSWAKLLKAQGYQSSFYHGGTNGTMSFDVYAKSAGFDHYKGRNEYAHDEDYDGTWGIWDIPYLDYCVKDISQNLKPPFIASIFTLSSHPPYVLPKAYQDQFPKGTLPIHPAIAYTDRALSLFFKAAQKQSWYEHTLFVIVADHCSPLSTDAYYNFHQGRFAIPLLFYCPSDSNLKGRYDSLCQQIDIYPSVLDYLGYSKRFFAFGNSIFSSSPHRFCIQQWGGNILWTLDTNFLQCKNTEAIGLYHLQKDPLCQENLIYKNKALLEHTERYLKAFRQNYHQAMIENQLYTK